MSGLNQIGAARQVVSGTGGVEMGALSLVMPELLTTTLPEASLGLSGLGSTIVHGFERLAERGISKEAAEEAVRTAKEAGNVTTKIGRYGQEQSVYRGSNGITVVVQNEGRNAGSVITGWFH